MRKYLVFIYLIFTAIVSGQIDDMKYSLAGIKNIAILVQLQMDDYSKNSINIDESVFYENIRYSLNMARMSNKKATGFTGDIPILTLTVTFNQTRKGQIDAINTLRLWQKLSFPRINKKLFCITWVGNTSTLYLNEKWNSNVYNVFMQSVTENVKIFISDFLEVNNK